MFSHRKGVSEMNGLMQDKRVRTLLKLFGCCVFVLILATIGYKELPILVDYSLLGDDSFYSGLITNMYASVIDFFMFSIVLFIFFGRHEKEDKIQGYKDNIDDCRHWFSEEAAFKNAGNIRRLKALGVKSLDLSKTTLINTKLKGIELKDSLLMGACLDGSNFDKSKIETTDFNGVSANRSSFNTIKMQSCNLKYFVFQDAQMMNSVVTDSDFTKGNLAKSTFRATTFKGCCFERAILDGCIFERADLRNVVGLTSAQLLTCANIMYAKLDPALSSEIDAINPKLLRK